MRILILSIIIAIMCIFTLPAIAQITYSFEAMGKNPLFTDVSDASGNQALSTFRNAEPTAGLITDVYFDDGRLLGASMTTSSTNDVQLSPSAVSHNLPNTTIAALDTVIDDLANNRQRIGIDVQGLAGWVSEPFVNNGDGITPTPGAVLLASIGMVCVGWLRKRGYF